MRDGLTDYLEACIDTWDIYGPIREQIENIEFNDGAKVLDLCSGAGGPWRTWVSSGFAAVPVVLTDKYPNVEAFQKLEGLNPTRIAWATESVDALAVSAERSGFRTIFTAFHHFRPEQAQAIINDAVSSGQPIGIFEFTYRDPRALLLALLSPIGVWMLTPRMRRFSWSKALFTYLIPLIPLIVTFDGVISCLRTYSVEELRRMARSPDYKWSIGRKRGRRFFVTFLVGYPAENSAAKT